MKLRAATRGSVLALWQTNHVANLLAAYEPGLEVDTVVVSTTGDRVQDKSLAEIGGKGVFVKEVQAALLDGRADIAVHSTKDLPAVTPEGLVIATIPERGDPRDALVGSTLADLPQGAEVATGSGRRRAQLAHLRPDLRFADLRGNMQTRLAKARDHDVIVVAATAIDRLGLDVAMDRLDVDVMTPQVGQAALAVECRADHDELRALLAQIEHADTRRAVDAERAFLLRLGGDCDLPAGAYAVIEDEEVVISGVLASLDGITVLRHAERGTDAAAAGTELARVLLDDMGGTQLLS